MKNNDKEIFNFMKSFEELDDFINIVNDEKKYKEISAKIFESIFEDTKNITVDVNMNLMKKRLKISKKKEGIKRIGNPKFIKVFKKVRSKYGIYTRKQWVSAIQDKIISDARRLKSLFYNQANKIKDKYFKNSNFIYNESIEIGKNYKLKFSIDLTKLDDYEKLHDLFSDIFTFKLEDSVDIKIENFMEFIDDFDRKIQANYKVTSHALDERGVQRIIIPVLEKLHFNDVFSNSPDFKEKFKNMIHYGAYKEKADEALSEDSLNDLYKKIFKEFKNKYNHLNKNKLKNLVDKEYYKIKNFMKEYYNAVENNENIKKLHEKIYKDYYKYLTSLKLTLFRNVMKAIKSVEYKSIKETNKTFGEDDLKEVEQNSFLSDIKEQTKAIGIAMRLLSQNVIAIVRKLKLNNGQYEYILSTVLANPNEKLYPNIDELYVISDNKKLFEGLKNLKFLKSKDSSIQKLDNPEEKLII